MSFTYSDPRNNDRDKVRFLIGDTNVNSPLLQDKEILYLIEEEVTTLRAAVAGALGLAAKFSRLMDESVGSVSKSYSQRAIAFRALAKDLSTRNSQKGVCAFAGGVSEADKEKSEQDPDSVKPSFTRDLHNSRDIDPLNDGDDC